MEPGFYWVHLASRSDDDWVLVYLRLDSDGRVDTADTTPSLAKARWGGEDCQSYPPPHHRRS
jgi:hypothetical protein